jgi:flavodoxin
MKALVIYDSVYGNTEKIARAIREALGTPEEVKLLRVGEVTPDALAGVDLLVVGSPTQKFRPLPSATSFVNGIPSQVLKGVRVAAFDTRLEMDETQPGSLRFFEKIFGYAADPLADGLKKKGGKLVLPPEGFIVEGMEGPLKEGELERAADWGKRVKMYD